MDIKNPLLIFWLRIGTLVYSEPARFICPFEAKTFLHTPRARRALYSLVY
jgi:hypothetical protein